MKVTSDNVKAGLMLGAVGLLAYAVYRAYKLGDQVTDTVTTAAKNAAASVTGAVDSAVGRITDGSGLADYSQWVRDFWVGEPAISDAEYPEPQPIRAAMSAAESSAITSRYVAPGATFDDYTSGAVFGGYLTGLGADAPISTFPQEYSPDSFYALAQEK